MIELNHRYTHKFKSQFLSIDEIDSDWGTDLELNKDEFAQKLDNPERMIHEDLEQATWPARNYINGLLMLEGLLKVDGYSEGKYEAYLGAGLYEFGKLVEGKLLSDIDLGGVRTWTMKSSWDYPTDDFAIFPVFNPGFYGRNEDETDWKYPEYISENLGGYQNCFNTATGVLKVHENFRAVVTPFPFVAYLLKRIFAYANYSIIVNEFEENPHLVKKCLYSNYNLLSYTQFNSQHVMLDWTMNQIIPEIDILDFLIGLQNDLNITFDFDARNREVKILDREKRMNMAPSRLLIDKIIPNSTTLKLSKDKLGVELQPAFDNDDEYFTTDNAWAEIKEDDNITDPVATVDDLPYKGEVNEIKHIIDQDFYFQYNSVDDEETGLPVWDWRPYARNQQAMRIGKSDYDTIESIFALSFHIGYIQRGNYTESTLPFPKYPCKPKLMNYLGPLGDPAIPRGDVDGSTEYNAISNDLRQGQNPRYITRWQSTVRFFISRQEGSFIMRLTPAELRDLDTTIPYLHPDGFIFFLDEGTCELYEGIDTAEIDTKFYTFN